MQTPRGHFQVPPLKEEAAMVPVKGAAAEVEAVAVPLQDRDRKWTASNCSPKFSPASVLLRL